MFIYLLLVHLNQGIDVQLLDDYSPIIVIQPQYEQMQINLYGRHDHFSNTSFSYNGISYPEDNHLIIENTTFIQETAYTSINQQFCPVYDWSPPYQPVHFYLSPSAIDLIIYSKSEGIAVIEQSIHQDLTDIDDSIKCYSLFELNFTSQFAIDCDLNGSKAILVYQLELNRFSLIIENFTFINSYNYSYINSTFDDYINDCQFRVVEVFNAISENGLVTQYLQYCPQLTNQWNKFYFLITESIINNNGNLTINAKYGSISNMSNTYNYIPITQILVNPLLTNYNYNSWNLAFLFKGINGIFKCSYGIQMKCGFTRLEFFEPTIVKSITNLNDQLILATATNSAVYVLYLGEGVENENYVGFVFKDIYEKGYSLLDIQITEQYLSVIMSETIQDKNVMELRLEMCFGNNRFNFSEQPNLLKIYRLDQQSEETYYQNFIQNNAFLLQSLNYAEFGDFFIYYTYSLDNENLTLIQVNDKQLLISYNTTNISQPYQPIVAQLTVTALFKDQTMTLTTYLIICLALEQYDQSQLVGDGYNINVTELPLQSCPQPKNLQIYQSQLNSINLLDGVMGPLITFSFIPKPEDNPYYPIYIDYQQLIPKSQTVIIHSLYKIYSAETVDLLSLYNAFGNVRMFVSYQTNPSIYTLQCQIVTSNVKDTYFMMNLQLEHCVNDQYRRIPFLNRTDYFQQLLQYEFLAQYDPPAIFVCEKFKSNCAQIEVLQNDKHYIEQFFVQVGPFLGDQIYFLITMLFNQPGFLYHEYVAINQTQELNGTLTPVTLLEYIPTSRIVGFQYISLSQVCLFLFFEDASFSILTQGPVDSLQQPIFYNYTYVTYRNESQYCSNLQNRTVIGFLISEFGQEVFQQKYLLIWCSNEQQSYIEQFIINSITLVRVWRLLPLYNFLLSNQNNYFISGYYFYVPVLTINPNKQTFLIYNLKDYSPRTLADSITVNTNSSWHYKELVLIINFINQITCPVTNIKSIKGKQSFALIASQDTFFLYYNNQNAKIVFNLYNNTIKSIQNQALIVLISQPNKVSQYRYYNITYDFSKTQITINGKQPINVTLDSSNQRNFLNETTYYQYLLLFNDEVFSGPIVYYNASTSNNQVLLLQSPYLQLSRYLGVYVETISKFGLTTHIISLSDVIYQSFYFNNYIPNYKEYSDLIIILTTTHVLFYQKKSNKSEDKFFTCNDLNYTQPDDSYSQFNECQIRQIHHLKLSDQENLICYPQINQLNELLIVCQSKSLNLFQQVFQFIQYDYNQSNNSITIIRNLNNSTEQYCYCYFQSIKPFFYNNQSYQVIKHTYMNTNSYFGIYQFNSFSLSQIDILLYLPSQNDQPYNQIEDFTLYINLQKELLTILILESNLIIYQDILLNNFTALIPLQIVPYWHLNNTINDLELTLQYFELKFIKAIDQMSQTQTFILGNNNIVFEIGVDKNVNYTYNNQSYLNVSVHYVFLQYQICHSDLIQSPQFITINSKIEYMVTLCISKYFEYLNIQAEMTYIYDVPTTNMAYISLFRRNPNSNFSQPVQILEPMLINPQHLVFLKFQLYTVNYNNTHLRPYLLISNTSYFMLEFYVYPKQGYYLIIPSYLYTTANSFNVYVQANNDYSYNSSTFVIQWRQPDYFPNKIWFYTLTVILGLVVIALIIYFCYHCQSKNKSKLPLNLKKQKLFLQRSSMEQGVELQRKTSMHETIKKIFRN